MSTTTKRHFNKVAYKLERLAEGIACSVELAVMDAVWGKRSRKRRTTTARKVTSGHQAAPVVIVKVIK